MVEGRVHQDPTLVPCRTLDPDSLVDEASLLQRLVRNCDRVLAKERHIGHVRRPHHIFDGRRRYLGYGPALLNVVQNHRCRCGEQELTRPGVIDLIHDIGCFERLGAVVLEITNGDRLVRFLKHCESVTRDKDGRVPRTTLAVV